MQGCDLPPSVSCKIITVYMKVHSIAIIIILAFLLSGCTAQKRNMERKLNKMETCQNFWTYKDLKEKIEIRVLLFNKKFNYDLSHFPNFAIGVTSDLDTIGIIDNVFQGTIIKNDYISVLPTQTTVFEKVMSPPVFSVNKGLRTVNLFCSVKTVYYGQIVKK